MSIFFETGSAALDVHLSRQQIPTRISQVAAEVKELNHKTYTTFLSKANPERLALISVGDFNNSTTTPIRSLTQDEAQRLFDSAKNSTLTPSWGIVTQREDQDKAYLQVSVNAPGVSNAEDIAYYIDHKIGRLLVKCNRGESSSFAFLRLPEYLFPSSEETVTTSEKKVLKARLEQLPIGTQPNAQIALTLKANEATKGKAFSLFALDNEQPDSAPTPDSLEAPIWIKTNRGESYLRYELYEGKYRRGEPSHRFMPRFNEKIVHPQMTKEALTKSFTVSIETDNPSLQPLLSQVSNKFPSCILTNAKEGVPFEITLCGKKITLIPSQNQAPQKFPQGSFEKTLEEVKYCIDLGGRMTFSPKDYLYDILQGEGLNRKMTLNGKEASLEERRLLEDFFAEAELDKSPCPLTLQDGVVEISFVGQPGDEINYFIDHQQGIVFLTRYRKRLETFAQENGFTQIEGPSYRSYQIIPLPKELFPFPELGSTTLPAKAEITSSILNIGHLAKEENSGWSTLSLRVKG